MNAGGGEIAMIAASAANAEGVKNAENGANAEGVKNGASVADLVPKGGAGVRMIAVVIAGIPADRCASATVKIGSHFAEIGNGAEESSKGVIVPCAARTGTIGRRIERRAAKV